ncbi:MAG: peptide chain release factor N(5)-glutamine methyltransferase [Paludibacter sp.]|nr:peptide chain release factor N(5)-glutamine methyltransferase [Paludibacter sp.]
MQDAIDYIAVELNGLYPEEEIRGITKILLSEVTGFSFSQLIINKNTKISDEQNFLFCSFVEKLKNFEPLQYILGKTEFMGLNFIVNPSVLIPRPETEELVEWILNDLAAGKYKKVLDIGTGSGCIPVALKKNVPDALVAGVDVSEDALDVAKQNARINGVDVNFNVMDILLAEDVGAEYDIIVSNPPYIPERDKAEMHPNVLDYEPHLALFVPDDDPLKFYKAIADFAKKYLAENGQLYFEIHRDFGLAVKSMLLEKGFGNIELRRDLSGNDRMIKAMKA